MTLDFPKRKYDIILADPPWPYYGDPQKMGAAGKEYALMSYDELSSLPVSSLQADPCVLFLWTTSSQLAAALGLMEDWLFCYRGVAYVWVKTAKDGRIIHGQGVRPSFTKPTTELLLVGSSRAKGRTFPLANEGQQQVVLHPRLRHSEKPSVFHSLIEQLFLGEYRRIELFARQEREGWDTWGNEI
jgi:N6-adenosine-specific RNA methylase IME4